MFQALLLFASVAAGAIASVAGFGVGSVLTPVFARGFGLASAAGGLAGALLQSRAGSRTLDLVLGGLLLLAGLGELTGLARRIRLRGKAAWVGSPRASSAAWSRSCCSRSAPA